MPKEPFLSMAPVLDFELLERPGLVSDASVVRWTWNLTEPIYSFQRWERPTQSGLLNLSLGQEPASGRSRSRTWWSSTDTISSSFVFPFLWPFLSHCISSASSTFRILQRLKQCRDVQIFVESHSSRLMFPFKLWPPVFLTSSFLKARKEV